MGGSKSSSKSSQAQSTSTLADDSLKDISSSGGGVQAVDFSNIQTLTNPQVTINTDGLQGGDVVELINSFGIGVENVIGTISQQADKSVSSITRVAESATGTTSEVGATINKFALPVVILLGLYILLKTGVFK